MKPSEVQQKTCQLVLVIGGGLSGLASAYYLQKQAQADGLRVQITILESENSLGGKIITEEVDGFTIEGGPDCFIRQKPWAAELIRELGMGDDLIGTNDDRRKVFVVNKGKLTPLPDGVMLIVPTRIWPFVTSPLISWPGKLRMGMDFFVPPFKNGKDESVADFVRRRLGTEALEKIAEPLLSGVHVSDPEQQSLLATFPRFRALEVKHGNLIRGMLAQRKHMPKTNGGVPSSSGPSSIFISMRRGMSSLIKGLQTAVIQLGCKIQTGTQVARIEFEGREYRVLTQAGDEYKADAVIMATPSDVSAKLLKDVSPQLSRLLESIEYVSTATISLGFSKDEIGHPLNGFGFVIPRQEKRKINACTWTSTKFNYRTPQDHVLIRCFAGGPGHEEDVDLDDSQLYALIRDEIKQLMGITAQPRITRIFRWRKSHPQYKVGHLDRLEEMKRICKLSSGLYITGSSYGGVGLPDCVRQGKETALEVIHALKLLEADASSVLSI